MRATTIFTLLAFAAPGAAMAGVVGYMTPAEPLTVERIRSLPAAQQAPWFTYLARSHAQMDEDKATLAAERAGQPAPEAVPYGRGGSGMPLHKPAAWYGNPEARRVADTILSFQTPAGGWGKNANRAGPPRARGQSYVGDNGWSYVGTIDNDATVTELRFLARVQAQAPGAPGNAYRTAIVNGVRYLLRAQYPNGGFPQIYPLAGGYHDAVTINDNAMVNVMELLADVTRRQDDFSFIPANVADAARDALSRSVNALLAAQISAGGVLTGWAQQYDELTLAPAGARNFEPVALSSAESARVLLFLMSLPNSTPEINRSIRAGAAWLERAAVRDVVWTGKSPDKGRMLIPGPGAGPLWARYYDIATMKPIFGDRDRSIHDDVNEISIERRNGYGWYGPWPAEALAQYAAWSRAHP